MPETVSIEIEGIPRLDLALKGVLADLADLRSAWRPVSDEVYSIVRSQYSTRGARGPGGAWPANKESTVARYTAMNRRGFSVINEPMRRTDTLFISETTRGGPHGIYEEAPDSLTMGTDLEYGAIWQARNRRQYDFTEDDGLRLLRILKRGLKGKVIDRGFDYVEGGQEIPF
jgi:hypothetical protein